MTMTTVSDARQLLLDVFLYNVVVVDQLNTHVPGSKITIAASEKIPWDLAQLDSPEGRWILASWRRAFRRSIDIMHSFRDAARLGGLNISDDELRAMAEASFDPIRSLQRRLTELQENTRRKA